MSALRRFELFVQRVVESPFSRLAGMRLQPVQLAKRLEQELDAQKTISVGRVYAPNVFSIAVGPRDFEGLEQFVTALQTELEVYVATRASERGYAFVGPVEVEVRRDDEAGPGSMRVTSALREPRHGTKRDPPTTTLSSLADAGPPAARATSGTPKIASPAIARLDIREEDGEVRRMVVAGPVVRLGRGLDNDVVLESLSVSRYHAQIAVERAAQFSVRDLGSTNGTLRNGEAIQQETLRYGDTVRLGDVEIQFLKPT